VVGVGRGVSLKRVCHDCGRLRAFYSWHDGEPICKACYEKLAMQVEELRRRKERGEYEA